MRLYVSQWPGIIEKPRDVPQASILGPLYIHVQITWHSSWCLFFFFYIFASPEHLIWDSVHSVLGLSGCLQCFGHFVFSLAVKKPDQGRALSMGPFYLIASSNLANRPIIVIDCPGAFDAFNSVAIRICHRDTVCLATQAVFSTHFSYIAWLLLTKFESL